MILFSIRKHNSIFFFVENDEQFETCIFFMLNLMELTPVFLVVSAKFDHYFKSQQHLSWPFEIELPLGLEEERSFDGSFQCIRNKITIGSC